MSVHKALIFITLGISIYILCYDSIILRKTARVMSLRSKSNIINNSKPTTTIFYNLYTRDASDVERVRNIAIEQLSLLLPDEHHRVYITSIGAPQDDLPSFLPDSSAHITEMIQHHPVGGEDLTLHQLWDYCRVHPYHDTKVVYLHSKGSFHASMDNTNLRKFITRAALSEECANLPDTCDVCSGRMSPLPHPHTSGNMWVARCDYVAKLVNPTIRPEDGAAATGGLAGEREMNMMLSINNPQRGWGRFFFEHWVHLHPSVRPCDIYPGRDFMWGKPHDVPQGEYEKELRMAPRFDFETYNIEGWHHKPMLAWAVDTIWEFDMLYNQRPEEEDWWGWEFYNITYAEMIQPSIEPLTT